MAIDIGAALASVAVGALASTAATTALDRIRYRHDLQVRWDLKKSEAFTAYLAAVVTMARLAGQVAGYYKWDPRAAAPKTAEDLARVISEIEAAEARRSATFEAVILLANHRTIHAGHELNKAAWSLEWVSDHRRKGSTAIWSADRDRFQVALHEFHTAMREDLKVPGTGPSEVVVEDLGVSPDAGQAPSIIFEATDQTPPDDTPSGPVTSD